MAAFRRPLYQFGSRMLGSLHSRNHEFREVAMARFEIERVPVLQDNYVWLVHEPAAGVTAVVDPAVPSRCWRRRGGAAGRSPTSSTPTTIPTMSAATSRS